MIAGLRSYLEALPHEAALKPLPILLASVLAAVVAVLVRLSTAAAAAAAAAAPRTLHTLNPKGAFEISDRRVKAEFQRDATRMLRDWFSKNPDKPVVINGDMGAMTVLPPSMANEIRNDPRLSFIEFTMEMFHSHLHGFEPFTLGQSDDLIQSIVRKDLTKQLAKVTAPLVEETSLALRDILTDSTEWHEANVRQTIQPLIARISSRVFLGAELCRDPDWLRITQSYTVAGFEAARQLRYWPAALRPLANRWLPACLTAQAMLREARAVMAPVLARRYAARAAAGDAYVESNDAMDWFATADPDRALDAVSFQLALSFAAIHTTTDLLAETLLRIAQHPDVLAALRDEVVQVYREDGWEKSALYKMKLLDGAIKETQRMKPISEVTMLRKVKEAMTLSDGTRLRAGQNLGVTSTHFRSAAVYSSPDAWDPRRWTRMRADPARQNAAHLVSTTPEHNAFGHGRHACPGRFFAANEIKVALLAILLRYDVEVPVGARPPRAHEDGLSLVSDPIAVLRFRRRDAEIDLDAACGEAPASSVR